MPRLSAAAAAMIMVFMVSLHLPASPFRAGHCLRQGDCPFCDDGKMGFHPMRDNRTPWHMIYARHGVKL
jgi:hypothetical protein